MTRRDVQGWGVAVLPLIALLSVLGACSGGGSDSGGNDPADPRAPSGLTYQVNPASYVKGVAIVENRPSTTGGEAVTRYSISPTPMLAGLSFNTSTGAITGTPSEAKSQTYTVTASNDYGSTTVQLAISVQDSGGAVIAGKLTGSSPTVARMEVRSESGTVVVGTATPNSNGEWWVGGVAPGKYVVRNLASSVQVYPPTQPVTVTSGNVSGVNFYLAPASDKQSFCSIVPTSSTAKIGGPCVGFQAVLVNWTQSTLSSMVLEVRTKQGSVYSPPAYTTLSGCGNGAGDLQPGACTVSGQLCVPSTPFVAGAALLFVGVGSSDSSSNNATGYAAITLTN